MQYPFGRLVIETAYVDRYRSVLRHKDGEVLACGESQTGWAEALRNMGCAYQEAAARKISNLRAVAAVA